MSASIRPVTPIGGHQFRKLAPLASIILLHVGFFYALQSGLLRQAVQSLPKEVFVSFITQDPVVQPEPPKPKPAPPKTLPVVKQTITPPPLPPIVNKTPSEQAITVPVPVQTPEPPAPAAVAPTVAAVPKTISTGVEYLQAPQPEYPALSRRMREEGKVVLRVLVDEKGRAERIDVQQSSGTSRLDEAARKAVQRAQFKPHLEDGKAVPVYVIVPIKFQLD